jgi:peroxiredoxin (alkyl hydroperoxide reductase subunit C)
MAMIGKKAPIFRAPAVTNGNDIVQDFSLAQFLGKKEVVFFFYPKDFTFVCPTELLAFQDILVEFEQRNVAIVGCSTDSEESHLAWLQIPREKGGIAGVTYPLVADATKTIAANYGVLGGDWDYDEDDSLIFQGLPIAYRGAFLIDKQGFIRHETINELSLGRNVRELLRVVDMWHHIEQFGEVCPVNWEKGQTGMQPTHEGVVDYLSKKYSNAQTNNSL